MILITSKTSWRIRVKWFHARKNELSDLFMNSISLSGIGFPGIPGRMKVSRVNRFTGGFIQELLQGFQLGFSIPLIGFGHDGNPFFIGCLLWKRHWQMCCRQCRKCPSPEHRLRSPECPGHGKMSQCRTDQIHQRFLFFGHFVV